MIPLCKVFISKQTSDMVSHTLQSGWIGQGTKVEQFEEILKSHFDYPFLLTMNSCTSALSLAFNMFTKGQRVAATPLTCIATTAAMIAAGCEPFWVDIDPNTMNMDLHDLARKIHKVNGVSLVHYGGVPCDVSKISTELPIIEDCAHAWGSRHRGKLIGLSGNVCCFSFQATKLLTTADGGLMILPSEDEYKKAKLLRWYGIDREKQDDSMISGYKIHMNDINASIGVANYSESLLNLRKHIDNAEYYNKSLKGIDGIELLNIADDCQPSYQIYTIKVKNKDDFQRSMQNRGIEVKNLHKRNDDYSCYSRFYRELPQLDSIYNSIINLPVGWWVSKSDREFIVDSIKKGW